jgi:hypothetical protein
MTAVFNSQTNKELLWRFMYENKMFANIDNALSTKIQQHFDTKIQQIYQKKNAGDTLITLNKQLITEMLNDIKTNFIPVSNNIQMSPSLVTAQEITQNRQKSFDQQLKTKQNEFVSMINAPKPDLIDFADKPLASASVLSEDADEKVNASGEIERLLAETIAKRENMLLTFNEVDKTKAANWVNNQRENVEQRVITPSQQKTKQLKIGADTDLMDNNNMIFLADEEEEEAGADQAGQTNYTKNKIKKSVTFNDESNQFIDSANDDITKTLKEINEKLNKVIEMLTPKEL